MSRRTPWAVRARTVLATAGKALGLARVLLLFAWQFAFFAPAYLAGCAVQCVLRGWRAGRSDGDL